MPQQLFCSTSLTSAIGREFSRDYSDRCVLVGGISAAAGSSSDRRIDPEIRLSISSCGPVRSFYQPQPRDSSLLIVIVAVIRPGPVVLARQDAGITARKSILRLIRRDVSTERIFFFVFFCFVIANRETRYNCY